MRILLLLTAGLCVSGPLASAGDEAKGPDHGEFFEARIRPILVEHCFRVSRSEEAGIGAEA